MPMVRCSGGGNPIKYKKNWTNPVHSTSGTYGAPQVNITDYPDYRNITANDILVVVTGMQSLAAYDLGQTSTCGAGVTWTYNSVTGIVSIRCSGAVSGHSIGATSGYVAVL